MPLIDTPPDAVARVYARSLLELTEAEGGRAAVESAQAELEDILEIARADAKFGEFLSSRVISSDDRTSSLKSIFSGRVSDLTLRFLLVLNDKGRLPHLPAISAAFDSLVQEKFGRIEVDVFTAEPLTGDDLRSMRERLGQALKKEVVVYPYTESAMIGGVKFRIGDQLIDASLATQLRQMRDQIERDGASAARSAIDRIIDDRAN
ncbi:MAG: ATP synthase F1 subunit delta [Phycisphaerae bacterium]|nr:ATP synthase F1 subunit delta [Phycisphaerae bacterium]